MLSLPCFALIQFQNPFLSSIRRSRLLNGAAHMDDNMCFITHESRSPPKKIWRWEMETWWTSLFLFLLKWQFQFYCSLIAPHAQSGCPINCNHSSRHLSMSLTVGYVALPCLMFHYSPPPHPFVIWYLLAVFYDHSLFNLHIVCVALICHWIGNEILLLSFQCQPNPA